MELFLVRHGIAVPAGPTLPDADRPLSELGRERFAEAVVGLQRLGVRFDRLYASPWRRAAETAALLQPLLDGESVTLPALACPPDKGLLEEIAGERAALVGHQPWMGELLAWLTCGSRSQGDLFPFKRGGTAWIEGRPKPGRMTLHAFLPPKVLRALANTA